MDKQLSIVIPVYNVEKYIRPCIESILRQGLSEEQYEMVIVNDGTPDHSMEQIADIIESHTNITVINQENQGVSVARNNGLMKAKGEYVMFIDSDDLVIDGSLPIMLEKVQESKVELAMAGLKRETDETITMPELPHPSQISWSVKTGEEAFMQLDTCSIWRYFFNRKFLLENQLLFAPNITLGEDTLFCHQCWTKTQKSLKTNLPMIIYRYRSDSVTHRSSLKDYRCWGIAIGKTWELRSQVAQSPAKQKRIERNIFWRLWNQGLPSITTNFTTYRDRVRALEIITKEAPDLRFTEGQYQKVFTFLYHHSPRLLMTLWILRWNRIQRNKKR